MPAKDNPPPETEKPYSELTREEKAEFRRAKRRFTHEDAPPALLSAAGSLPEEFWPSKSQYWRWEKRLDLSMEATIDGWLYGFCPIIGDGVAQAMFNFHRGSMRCIHEPPCHGAKRGMTLNSVIERTSQEAMANA